MTWQVIWSEKSVKQLGKIDKKTAQNIFNTVLDCSHDPLKTVTKLSNSSFYKIRVGNYRVILDLQQNKLVIFVIEVDHRKRIYKK